MIISLQPPPRDDTGRVVPHDHPGILDGFLIVRGVTERHFANAGGQLKISTMLMQPSSGSNGGMSMDVGPLINWKTKGLQNLIVERGWIGAVVLEVEKIRALDLMVGWDPLDDNPAHGEVWGNFTRSKKKALLACAKPIGGFLPPFSFVV